MVTLPFGAMLGDELVTRLRFDSARGSAENNLPAISWGWMHPYSGPDREGWALFSVSKDEWSADGIVEIDGASFYVSPVDQQRMRLPGRVLDFEFGEGIVEQAGK